MFKLRINGANQINNTADISKKIKNTLLMDISKKMGQLPLKSSDKDLSAKDMQKKAILKKLYDKEISNPLEYKLNSEKNPFCEYDANLNPFNN